MLVEWMFYNGVVYFNLFQEADCMGDVDLVEFEKDRYTGLDSTEVLARLAELNRNMREANTLKFRQGSNFKFDLNYLFADVLDCLDLLSFNNLSKVIGIGKAGLIWNDVKKEKK